MIGLKPPWARVPALPPYNLDQYCHDGPLARTVDDCALLQDVISGRHWRDGVALANPPQVLGAGSEVRGLSDYTRAFAAETNAPGLGFYEGLELAEPLGQLFERADALLCPTMATSGYIAGQPYLGSMEVGGSMVS